VEEEVERADRARRELERIRAEQDLQGGRGLRVGVAGSMGLLWSFYPFFASWIAPGGSDREKHLVELAFFSAVFVFFAVVMGLRREVVGRTAINRRVALGIPLIFFVQLAIHGAGYLTDQPFQEALISHFLFGMTLCATVSVAAEAYILAGSGLYLVGGLLALALPEQLPLILTVCNLGMAANYVAVWLLRKEQKDRSLGAMLWRVSEFDSES
jgi:hypothetical protein